MEAIQPPVIRPRRMPPKRKRQLIWIGIIFSVVAVATALILYSLRAQTDYFYSPSQISEGKAPDETRIKAGGMVVKGSLQRNPQTLESHFKITDFKSTIPVQYTGILPDLFTEGSGMVGTGELKNGTFMAEEILAKHDENYMPPDVKATLQNKPNGQPGMQTSSVQH